VQTNFNSNGAIPKLALTRIAMVKAGAIGSSSSLLSVGNRNNLPVVRVGGGAFVKK
jgi:hypothetical protein